MTRKRLRSPGFPSSVRSLPATSALAAACLATPACARMPATAAGDHVGQAADLPTAMLRIGEADWEALSVPEPAEGLTPEAVSPWLSGRSTVETLTADMGVYGDGSVRILSLPGHTPGHRGLLVELAEAVDIFIVGDQAHFEENFDAEGVPVFNSDRADTLASFARAKDLAGNTGATVIIGHDPAHVGKLPLFPSAAR